MAFDFPQLSPGQARAPVIAIRAVVVVVEHVGDEGLVVGGEDYSPSVALEGRLEGVDAGQVEVVGWLSRGDGEGKGVVL